MEIENYENKNTIIVEQNIMWIILVLNYDHGLNSRRQKLWNLGTATFKVFNFEPWYSPLSIGRNQVGFRPDFFADLIWFICFIVYSDGLYLETKRCASTFGAEIVGFRPMVSTYM